MISPVCHFYYDDNNLEISTIQMSEFRKNKIDDLFIKIIQSIKIPDEENFYIKYQTEELNDSFSLKVMEEEFFDNPNDFFQDSLDDKKNLNLSYFDYSLNISSLEPYIIGKNNKSKNDLFYNNEEKKEIAEDTLSTNISIENKTIFILQSQEIRLLKEYGINYKFESFAKDLHNLKASSSIIFNQNKESSSLKDSSFNSIKSVSNFNRKNVIFQVIQYNNRCKSFDFDNTNNKNVLVNKKRKREKTKLENKINKKTEGLDKSIFRDFIKFIRNNLNNKEIKKIKEEDQAFFNELIKKRRDNRKKVDENLFDFRNIGFKSYNQDMMKHIFSNKIGKKLYEIYLKNKEEYSPNWMNNVVSEGEKDKIRKYRLNFLEKYGKNYEESN